MTKPKSKEELAITPWPEEHTAYVLELHGQGLKAPQIRPLLKAKFGVDRTEHAIRNRFPKPERDYFWKDWQDELLKVEAPQGTPYGELAEKTGRTVHAVQERIRHLKIVINPDVVRQRRAIGAKRRAATIRAARPAPTPPPKPPAKPKVTPIGPVAGRKTLLELERNDCCWPIGPGSPAEQMFCAAPVGTVQGDKDRYCPKHREVATPNTRTDAERAADAERARKAKARGAIPRRRA